MLVPSVPAVPGGKRLLRLYAALAPADRDTLLAFAEFLAGRVQVDARAPSERAAEPLAEPTPIERPADETVIQAMRRLSTSYEMVDSTELLNEAAALMGAHVLQGRVASDVIDELEGLFDRAYQDLVRAHDAK